MSDAEPAAADPSAAPPADAADAATVEPEAAADAAAADAANADALPGRLPLTPLREGLWTMTAGMRFLGLVPLLDHGLLCRLSTGILAVINPVELTDELLGAARALEASTGCALGVIVSPGDWHHFYVEPWAAAWPEAALYVASGRNLRKQSKLAAREKAGRCVVLDREAPAIAELECDWELLPWLGCKQPPWLLSGDKKGSWRVEHLLFHRPSATLFVTDHVLAKAAKDGEDGAAGGELAVNGVKLGPNKGGFALNDRVEGSAALAAASAQRVLQLAPRHLVLSHGPKALWELPDGAAVELLRAAYTPHFLGA